MVNTKNSKFLFIFLFLSFCFLSFPTEVFAQKKKGKPSITKKRSKTSLQDRLQIKRQTQAQKQKKKTSRKGEDYSGNNIENKSKKGQRYEGRKDKTNLKESLSDLVPKRKPETKVGQQTKGYRGTDIDRAPSKKQILYRKRQIKKGRGGQGLMMVKGNPKQRRKRLSNISLNFSGNNLPVPSQGYIAKRNRQMNRIARQGMYINTAKYRRLRNEIKILSVRFNGPKNSEALAKVRLKKRPIPQKNKVKSLKRVAKTKRKRGKYDKKERDIWERRTWEGSGN